MNFESMVPELHNPITWDMFYPFINFLKQNNSVFIVLNGLIVMWFVVSLLLWRKGTKDRNKITNRYTKDGRRKTDTRSPINIEFMILMLFLVNMLWIAITYIKV